MNDFKNHAPAFVAYVAAMVFYRYMADSKYIPFSSSSPCYTSTAAKPHVAIVLFE